MALKKVIIFVLDLFFLIRPTLLVPVWTILFLGWITADERIFFQNFDLSFAKMFILFTAVVANIYIVNQIADRESDKINNKLFILSHNHIPVFVAWIFASGLLIFSLFFSWFWFCGDLIPFFIILSAAILGFFYNCPPFKLKDRPWGGFLANCFGHGILTYYAGWYAGAINTSQILSVESALLGFLFSLSAGFANGAVYLTSTISDMKGDEKVNKRTFAVAYGAKNTSLLATICVVFSFFTAFLIPFSSWIMLVPAAICIPMFLQLYRTQNIEYAFKTFRYPVVILSIATAFFVPYYAILVIATVIFSRIYYKKRFNHEYPSFSKE
ncbi:MAG: UbiA family prenyltransferase [Chitinivibrionia bacterium]|nr:UbiA family prenyltransferase [Chitinivibrionia bacterium]